MPNRVSTTGSESGGGIAAGSAGCAPTGAAIEQRTRAASKAYGRMCGSFIVERIGRACPPAWSDTWRCGSTALGCRKRLLTRRRGQLLGVALAIADVVPGCAHPRQFRAERGAGDWLGDAIRPRCVAANNLGVVPVMGV